MVGSEESDATLEEVNLHSKISTRTASPNDTDVLYVKNITAEIPVPNMPGQAVYLEGVLGKALSSTNAGPNGKPDLTWADSVAISTTAPASIYYNVAHEIGHILTERAHTVLGARPEVNSMTTYSTNIDAIAEAKGTDTKRFTAEQSTKILDREVDLVKEY